MSHLRDVRIVAGWEFRRYFKWKDQLLGLAFFLAVSVIWVGIAALAGSRGSDVNLTLIDLQLDAPADSRLHFISARALDSAQAQALQSGRTGGILTRRPDGTFELLVIREPGFKRELQELLDRTVQHERLAQSGLTPRDLSRVLEPAGLDVRFTDPARMRRGRPEKIAALVCAGLFLLAVFNSMAYLFTGIGGEKQLRVTESVIAAITPQAWIDGKMLGITAYTLATVGNLLAGGIMIALAAGIASDLVLPAAAVRPAVWVALGVFTLLGILLWNSFFAAVSSIISDPNTSSRSSLLMLPVAPVVLSLVILRDPDGIAARILSIFPLTSAPALPVRVILTEPHPAEIAASVALLLGSIWLLRRIAGRIFEVGMLLYGKEPSLKEVIRWARPRTQDRIRNAPIGPEGQGT